LHGAARSVHVDADTRTVRIVFGYPHRYAPRRPPRSLHIGSVTP
jgi:hypothetical protein